MGGIGGDKEGENQTETRCRLMILQLAAGGANGRSAILLYGGQNELWFAGAPQLLSCEHIDVDAGISSRTFAE